MRGDRSKAFASSKKNHKATLYSPSDFFGVFQSHPQQNQRESEFVVVIGASTHMLNKKDLNSAELETVRASRNPTPVVPANGKAQTNENPSVYVKDLDLLVTVHFFEDTLAVLSLGQLCEDHGYSYQRTRGQKPHLKNNRRK